MFGKYLYIDFDSLKIYIAKYKSLKLELVKTLSVCKPVDIAEDTLLYKTELKNNFKKVIAKHKLKSYRAIVILKGRQMNTQVAHLAKVPVYAAKSVIKNELQINYGEKYKNCKVIFHQIQKNPTTTDVHYSILELSAMEGFKRFFKSMFLEDVKFVFNFQFIQKFYKDYFSGENAILLDFNDKIVEINIFRYDKIIISYALPYDDQQLVTNIKNCLRFYSATSNCEQFIYAIDSFENASLLTEICEKIDMGIAILSPFVVTETDYSPKHQELPL